MGIIVRSRRTQWLAPRTQRCALRVFLLFVTCIQNASAQSKQVILISIDGFRPEMYLNSKWPTSNLQYLTKQGVYADHMKSVFPAYTYPSHTAMLTGALPARSGIYYNVKNDKGEWNWFTKDIKVKTIWQSLKENGMITSAVEWPISVSDDITWNIPEIWDKKHPEDRIAEARKYATKGLVEEIEKNATGKLDSSNMSEEYFSLDENSSRMAAYIFKTSRPNFLAVHFALLDGMEHEYGTMHDSVTLAIAMIDRCIGNIMESVKRSGMKDNTTIIVVGDHGFSDMHEVLKPNQWLNENNIRGRFVAAGGSCFYYGTDSKRMLSLIDTLKYRKYFKVYDRKKLDELGADSDAVFALAAVPGIVFGNRADGEQLSKVSGGHHGYDPNLKEMYTGFIAAGAGINKGKVITELCVTDIAPLIAKLLGIEFKCPDGKLVEGILE